MFCACYVPNTELEAFSPMVSFNPLSMVSWVSPGGSLFRKMKRFKGFLEDTEPKQIELDDLRAVLGPK